MRIAVLGAGSMGSVFAAKLSRVGSNVILYDRDQRQINAIIKNGLKVTDPAGEFTVEVQGTTEIADVTDVDMALVLVDGNATVEIAALLPGVLNQTGFGLTLQNGIGNAEALTAMLGRSKVLGGSTYVSAAMLGPGHAHNTNIGETVVGEFAGGLSERSEKIARLFSAAGLPTTSVANVGGHIWSKFALNCALNPICAITGLRPGEVVRQPEVSGLLDVVMSEILAVAGASGIQLPEADSVRHIREHAFLRYNKPSMLQHIETARPTEIATLNGALVREARRVAVPVPVNTALVALVRGIEARNARDPQLDEAALEAAACVDINRSTP